MRWPAFAVRVAGEVGRASMRQAQGANADRPARDRGVRAGAYHLNAGRGDPAKLAIMFMDERGLRFFQQSEGFELGVDLGVTVADEGLGGDISSATVHDPIIAFVFGERGLMGGISVEGGKITQIDK